VRAAPPVPLTGRTTVTVGTFDGVHRGHQAVLEEIVERARAAGRAAVLVTFEPHPLTIVAPERAPCLLTTAEEKRLLWPLFGLDYVDVLPFTESLRQMSPETFVRRVLLDRWRLGELVIGYDHGFGKDRAGDVETLARIGAAEGFAVDIVGPISLDDADTAISSSAVRSAVAAADFEAVERGLGRPYGALGEVVRGTGRGRGIGFPTANVALSENKCLPPDGVYAVSVELEGMEWHAMANLGPRPTFGEESRRLEVHLLDWSGEPLYGARPLVAFWARLREVRRFSDARALATQLEHDRDLARAAVAARSITTATRLAGSG
jgi:riboflavin kinase/FMN adenylyltransferase